MALEVEGRDFDGQVLALGSGGTCSLVVDRPQEAGGRRGISSGQLLHLAVTGRTN